MEGLTTHWGVQIPPNKVTALDINERFRLGDKSKEDVSEKVLENGSTR
ncbi:hypothetical protein [Robertmurraya sp. Marseille-Q9965]